MLPLSPTPSRLAERFSSLFLAILAFTLFAAAFAAKPVLQGGGAVLGLVAVAGLMLTPRDQWLPKLKELRLPLIMAAITIGLVMLSAIWSVRPDVALATTPKLMGIFALGFAMQVFVRTMPLPANTTRIYLPLALAAGLAAAYLMLSTNLMLQSWWSGADVKDAVINKGVGSMTFFIPAAFAVAWRRGAIHNGLLGLILVASLMLAVFSQAQSALMALLVMAVVLVLPLQFRAFWWALKALLILGVMLSPWIVFYAFEPFAKDMATGFMHDAASAPQRLEVWHAIAIEIFKSPIFGHGFDATRYIPHFESQELYQKGTTFMHPHNMALQFWMEYGAIGAVLGAMALVVATTAIQHVTDLRVRRLYLATFLAMLSVSLVGWGMWQTWWIVVFFMVWAGTVMAGRMLQQK